MFYLLLSVEYDGYDYSGWVKQKKTKTIQSELEKAFFIICKKKIWTLGASKTDAGVHACDQKVLTKLPFQPQKLSFFIKNINKILPNNINITNYKIVVKHFKVRATKEKKYIYTINDRKSDIFNYRYELKIDIPLKIKKLKQISRIFIGTHDFYYFSKIKPHENIITKRTINKIFVKRNKTKKIEIHFLGKSFIRHQIRIIVQNILECYFGKISLIELKKNLKFPQTDIKTKYCAKAHGLCLQKIKY